jgi:hypothetical protein
MGSRIVESDTNLLATREFGEGRTGIGDRQQKV